MRYSALMVLFALGGCSWGLNDLQARNAVDIETITERMVQVVPKGSDLEREVLDIYERAQVMKKDYGPPSVKITRNDVEADFAFNAYAGLVEARNVKRRKIKEIPGKIGGFVGRTVKSWIPWWMWWVGGVVAFVSLSGISLLALIIRKTRKGLREMIRLADRPEVKDKFKGKTIGVVKKEYRRMGERGEL